MALPKTPGRSSDRAMLRTRGKPDNDLRPEKPIASNIANSAPKNIRARTAHTKYTTRDSREMIQLLVIGR